MSLEGDLRKLGRSTRYAKMSDDSRLSPMQLDLALIWFLLDARGRHAA
jgi:hypothetical protein